MSQQDNVFRSAARPKDWVTLSRAYTFSFSAYSSGTAVVPDSATITIRKPGGAALSSPVSGATVTITPITGVMTYALAAQSELGANYIADVAYVVSGTTYDARFLFDVVRAPLRNVVIHADLVFHHPDLSAVFTGGETTTANYIRTAFEDVCFALQGKGVHPCDVMEAADLRRAIEQRALFLFFSDKAREDRDQWDRLVQRYENAYQASFAALGPHLTYDANQDGAPAAEGGETGRKSTGLRILV